MSPTRREFTRTATGIGATGVVGALSGTTGASARSTSSDPFSAMTFNIHHGAGSDGMYDLRRVVGQIWAADPDVLALQEVDRHFRDRSNYHDQVSRIAEALNMHQAYGANIDYGPTEASDGNRRQYGTAVLTKRNYPIVEATNHLLPQVDDREQRGLLEVKTIADGTPTYVYSTHLGLDEDERQIQVEAILEHTGSRDGPQLLLGDFNFTPDSAPYETLTSEFTDVAHQVGADGHTYPTPYESHTSTDRRRIDYVFSRGAVDNRSGRVVETIVSDHLPLQTTHTL